jgi:hypothetical protein
LSKKSSEFSHEIFEAMGISQVDLFLKIDASSVLLQVVVLILKGALF